MILSIKEILKTDTTTDFGFPVTYIDESGETPQTLSYNVFSNVQFRQICLQLFGKRAYNDWEDLTEKDDAIADFISSFNVWKSMRADTYGRRMYALSIKYNPLENYNGVEIKEGSFTHGETVTQSFTNRKDVTTDDTYTEKTFTNYKETTTDDTYTEKTFTDYKETTTDDTYTEKTFTNYKETTKDDTSVTRTYNQYKESVTDGEKTSTDYVSADDAAATFTPSAQHVEAQDTNDREITGSYTDTNSYTNGIEKSTTGSVKDQRGGTNGIEKSTTGSIKDQRGGTNGIEKSTTGSIKDQRGGTNGIINEKQGSETQAHSGTDTDGYTLTKHGNLGVTQSSDMLKSDYDILKLDITMAAIKEFMSTYTYYDCEVD